MQDIVPFIQHHPALCAGLAAVILLAVITEWMRLRQGTKRISPLETVRLMNREQAVVLDIRTAETFREGHIAGAIPVAPDELKNTEKVTKKITKYRDRPIVVVSAAEADAIKAATLLKQQGFQTLVLAGGMSAFRNAELPLVKG